MKVIELMEVLSKLDPEYQITFGRENPITPKIWYRTDLTRVSEYAYWLGNRMEELTIIPAKDSLLRFKSRKKEHEYQWDKFFYLKVVNHVYEYRKGYGEYPGQWEVAINLTYPSDFNSVAEWNKYMDHNGY